MYREKAQEVLKRLQDTNYGHRPNRFIDSSTEALIQCIANECKSTVILPEKRKSLRCGGSLTFDAVKKIILSFITNSNYIPREVLNSCIYEGEGKYTGLDADVEIYKGINAETGRHEAHLSRLYVDERDYYVPREEMENILMNYARNIVIDDAHKKDRSVPKINRLRLFKERFMHRRFSIEKLTTEYVDLLSRYSNITNTEVLRNSATYKVKQITSPKFIKSVLESIKNGTAIAVHDDESDLFKKIVKQTAAEMCEQMQLIPNLNSAFKEINQIFKDSETQLTAYTMDFRTMTPQEIENAIKTINKLSLSDEMKKYVGEDGYRSREVIINGTDIKLLGLKHVPDAMKILSEDIHAFVNNSSELSNEEYLKRATMFMYRFIRIHPFPDSNGRTSRAILNAIALNRDILVPFNKEQKREFTQYYNEAHSQLGDGYLNAVCTDSKEASEMERGAMNHLYEYVLRNACMPHREESKTKWPKTRENEEIIY